MKVSIKFKIDIITLEYAIAKNLFYKNNVTKKSILNAIKSEVVGKGISVIEFPEFWGDNIADYLFKEKETISELVEKFKSLIER